MAFLLVAGVEEIAVLDAVLLLAGLSTIIEMSCRVGLSVESLSHVPNTQCKSQCRSKESHQVKCRLTVRDGCQCCKCDLVMV